jgi:sucrose-6-phosphate hydrolase SacC (GH32 family)
MAWGRIEQPGMPFNQMILFPTEMRLAASRGGIRLLATPIPQISRLHRKEHAWRSISAGEANEQLRLIPKGPTHVTATFVLAEGDELAIHYGGSHLATISFDDLDAGRCELELLIDKTVAEVFVDHGARYIVCDIGNEDGASGLEFGLPQSGSVIESLNAYEMASIWNEKL